MTHEEFLFNLRCKAEKQLIDFFIENSRLSLEKLQRFTELVLSARDSTLRHAWHCGKVEGLSVAGSTPLENEPEHPEENGTASHLRYEIRMLSEKLKKARQE